MSKLDTLFGYLGDYESNPLSDQELNLSPSWAVPNSCLAFSLGVPYKGKNRLNKMSSVSQALPSLPVPVDSLLDSSQSFSWRAPEEQEFAYPWSLDFGDADIFGSSEEPSGKHCALDRGSEMDQFSSSEIDIINEAVGGLVGLACPGIDERATEGLRDFFSESNSDGEWDGVLKLVQEVTARFPEPKGAGGNTGVDPAKQKMDPKKGDKLGDQLKSESGLPAQPSIDYEGKCANGNSPDEIIKSLSSIQRNVEFIKEAVPSIVSQKQKFTLLVKRQCAAAVGAVKLISQLADAAAGIIPEIQRQVGVVPTQPGRGADNSDKKQEVPPVSGVKREGDGGECAGMERLIPTLAAVSVSPTISVPVKPVPQDSDAAFPLGANSLEATGASEFTGSDEKECASSLVADLFGPCGRITGADGFVAPSSSTTFEWGQDLDEAMKADGISHLRPEENPEDAAAAGVADEERSLGAAAQDDSDEGETKGADQLPLGSFTLMEIDDLEILTEQTHYCNICSKGFKRDANLRMHMRSHGGKYKSSIALVRAERAPKVVQEMVGGKPTRYSCPYVGCNRNVKHPKFQALKTMLCLKNHYRRSHCAKTLKCSICKSKQFSVVADLKTHEKHCGSDKWACSCGTTFSRKEKLSGHVSLFVGHVPVDASGAAHAVSAESVSSAAVPVLLQVSRHDGSLAAQSKAVVSLNTFGQTDSIDNNPYYM